MAERPAVFSVWALAGASDKQDKQDEQDEQDYKMALGIVLNTDAVVNGLP